MRRLQRTSSKLILARSGTTLSEVLVSLLVMSIGVVSLATLFPISVLRAVQATQLTNAANLRYNVESLLAVRPSLYSVGSSWQAGIAYAQGALVTPTELTSLKSPAVVFQCSQAGTSGPIEPSWIFNNGANNTDGTAVWTTFLLQNYIVDPLGEVLVESAYRRTANNGDFFGNYGITPPSGSSPPTPRQVIRAFSGISATPTEPVADDIGTLPDSWIYQADSKLVGYVAGATTCTIGGLQSNLVAPLPTNPFYPGSRIVLFDITGKISYVRPIYNITGSSPQQTIDWTPPGGLGIPAGGPLPLNFSPASARVESKERRYTWVLSVRRGFSGTSYMDVVVFFRRPFSGKDEQIYPATFTMTTDFGADAAPGVLNSDDDGNSITDFLPSGAPDPGEIGWPGSDDIPRNWVIVQYDAAGDKPFLKKGGFVTDADNLRWYRIIDYVEGDAINGYTPAGVLQKAGLTSAGLNPYPYTTYVPDSPTTAFSNPKAVFLRLESPIAQSSPSLTGLNPPAQGVPAGNAMLMRGVVEVYPIRTILTWGN